MSQLAKLKAASTLSDVAQLLEVKPGMLSFLLYKMPKASHYTKFEIPKRSGGMREIWAPSKELKLIQHRLSNLLQNCVEEINAHHGRSSDSGRPGVSHGFVRKRTTMTNARAHVTRRHVFNVDLHDFFGTINFGRVRGFFIKDKNFALPASVATVLAQIACHDNKLPQGSPCSPVISNLIGHTLDMLLVRLTKASGCTYTRYADDLTFSSNKASFPARIAKQDEDNKDHWLPGQGLRRLIEKAGFSVNEKKTRMQYRDSRQSVTGLVVNRKVNVPATYRYAVRAMVNRALTTGAFEFNGKGVDPAKGPRVGTNQQLLGMLSYIDQIDLFNKALCEQNGLDPIETPGRIKLFRQFLYFDAFYAISQPVIVCEGPTDNIYLKHAIKRLAGSHPLLADSAAAPKLRVRLFKYGERRTAQVTELTGGVGGICNLLKHYHDDLTTKIKAPIPRHPLVILIDNDSGADDIYGAISGITKSPRPKGRAPFIHVTGNVYVVPTPLGTEGEKSAIEDFFDAATLESELGGKKFSRAKKIDTATQYGKAAFARDVVAKKSDSIDFSRFSAVLSRLEAAIADYAARIKITAPG